MSNKIKRLGRILKTLDKRIVIWYKAHFLGHVYWRVIYGPETEVSEGITDFKNKSKAKVFAKESGGKAFIDYNFVILIEENSK